MSLWAGEPAPAPDVDPILEMELANPAGTAPTPAPAPEAAPTPEPSPTPAPAPAPIFLPKQIQPFGQFVLLEDGSIAVLSTDRERAGFRSEKLSITCDAAIFNPSAQTIYAEGHVTLVEGLTRVSCSTFFYDLKNARGWAEQAELTGLERFAPLLRRPNQSGRAEPYFSAAPPPGTAPLGTLDELPDAALLPPRPDDPGETRLLMLKTNKLWRVDTNRYEAEQARVTSSEMPHPEWDLTLKHVEYIQYPPADSRRSRGRLVGENAVGHLWEFPVFWAPWAFYPVALKGPFLAGEVGQSHRWGTFGNLRIGYDASDLRADHPDAPWLFLLPRRSYLDITPRSDRGMGGGVTLRWENRGDHPYDRLTVHAEGVQENWISAPADATRAQRFFDLRTLDRQPSGLRRMYDASLLYQQRMALQAPTSFDPNLQVYRGKNRTSSYGDLHLEREPVTSVRMVADVSFSDIHDPQYLEEYNPEVFRIFRGEHGMEYDPTRWRTSPRAVDQAALKTFWGDWVLEGRYEQPAERFQTAAPSFDAFAFHQPAYLPEARLFLLPKPLWGGFVLEGESTAGRLVQTYDPFLLGAANVEADRYGARLMLSRPIYMDGFSLRPRVGVQATRTQRYAFGPESATDQAIFLAGVEAVDRWSGRTRLSAPWLGFDGLEHIVEIFSDYDLTGRPRVDPALTPGIDAWDNVTELQVIRFGVRQSFLNLNAGGDPAQARRYGRLELSTEAFPDVVDARRLLYGGSFDSLVGSFQWRPRNYFQLDGWARYWLKDGFLESSSIALAYLPTENFRCTVRELHTGADSPRGVEHAETLYLDTEWDISRRWRMGYGVTYEFLDTSLVRKGVRYQRISLARDFGSMEVGGYVAVDPDRNETIGLVSLKVKASRAQAWPVRDNAKAVEELKRREAEIEKAKKEAAAKAAEETQTREVAHRGWMERKK